MSNRKLMASPRPLCKNCIHIRDEDERFTDLNDLAKDEWICKAVKIIDLLDGEVSYHSCRKARQNEKLCGEQAQWFKARP